MIVLKIYDIVSCYHQLVYDCFKNLWYCQLLSSVSYIMVLLCILLWWKEL